MYRTRATVVSLLLGVALAVPAAAQRVPDTPVIGNSECCDPAIAVEGSCVYIAEVATRNGTENVYFNRSLDGGGSWLGSAMQISSGNANANQVKMATSGSAVYVVWADARAAQSHVYFNRSLDKGATWLSSDVRLDQDTSGFFQDNLQIAASGSTVYVTWRHSGFLSVLNFNRSFDSGTTWLPAEIRIDRGNGTVSEPKLAASGSAVYAVWTDLRNPGDGIFFNRSLDSGNTWLTEDVRLSRGPINQPAISLGNPAIAFSDASVYVVWADGRNRLAAGGGDIYLNRSPDQGTTWLMQDVRLNTGPAGTGDRWGPNVAASDASVHVVWEDYRDGFGGDVYFNRSLDRGVTWLGSDMRLDTDPAGPGQGQSILPDIATSGPTVLVAWQDGRSGAWDIRFNRSLDQGTSWLLSDRRLDTDPGSGWSRGVEVILSGSSAYAVWSDDRSGSDEIYFSIPFGFVPYGSGKPGSAGLVPSLTGAGQVTLGNTVTVHVANGVGGAAGAVLAGGPGAKTALPLLGGTLHVIPTLAVPITLGGTPGVPGEGSFALPLSIPADQAFVGGELYLQGVLFDPGATGGVTLTDALEMWIG